MHATESKHSLKIRKHCQMTERLQKIDYESINHWSLAGKATQPHFSALYAIYSNHKANRENLSITKFQSCHNNHFLQKCFQDVRL